MSFHVEGPKTEMAREPTVESLDTRNLEAESIGSRAERMEGSVKLKTVTNIRPMTCICWTTSFMDAHG